MRRTVFITIFEYLFQKGFFLINSWVSNPNTSLKPNRAGLFDHPTPPPSLRSYLNKNVPDINITLYNY